MPEMPVKSSHTVVVVNDNATQLLVLSTLLKREGFTVFGFQGASAALEQMTESVLPDLIVTDLYMPGIDGWRFCHLLRSPEYVCFNDVPILVVSATFSGAEAEQITADLKANAFLPAPVDPSRFVQMTHELVLGKSAQRILRMLIVEDSPTLIKIMKKTFDAYGYTVDTALTGAKAAVLFNRIFYDVVILDYHLPDILGDALLVEFRSHNSQAVIIMITADPRPELVIEWMNKGASAYARKPFQPGYLLWLCDRARRERALLHVEDLLERRTQELRLSEERYRTLVENMNNVVYTLDEHGLITYVTPNVETLYGYNISDVLGKPFTDFVYPPDIPLALSRFKSVLSGDVQVGESRFVFKSQEVVWIRASARVRVENGQTSIQGFLMEITDLKEIEEALRRSHEQFELVLESVELGLWDWNIVTGEAGSNHQLSAMLGYGPDEISPHMDAWKKQMHPDDLPLVQKAFSDLLSESTRCCEAEYRLRTKSGEWKWVLTRGKVISRDDTGKALRAAGTHLDLTARKEAEASRIFCEQQTHQMQKSESLARMAGAIAHSFNNILSVVIGNLDMALQGMPQTNTSYVSEAQKAAFRAAEVGRLMLTYLGQIPVRRTCLELDMICDDFLNSSTALIPKHICIHKHYTTPSPVIDVDIPLMRLLLTHLFTNAWESMNVNAGDIEVSLGILPSDRIPSAHVFPIEWQPKDDAYAFLEIRDCGCGMEPELISRICDPFFSTKFTGRGMGLSVVLGIVRSHDGAITVQSQPGLGTTVQALFPICTTAAAPFLYPDGL
jgi:PAS domain S-box-containing protein